MVIILLFVMQQQFFFLWVCLCITHRLQLIQIQILIICILSIYIIMNKSDHSRHKPKSKTHKQHSKISTQKLQIDIQNPKNTRQLNHFKNYINISFNRKNKLYPSQRQNNLPHPQNINRISCTDKITKISQKQINLNKTVNLNEGINTTKTKTVDSFRNSTLNNNKTKIFEQQMDLLRSQNELLKEQNEFLKKKIERYECRLQLRIEQKQNERVQKIQIQNKYYRIKQKNEQIVLKVKQLYQELIKQKKKNKDIRDFVVGQRWDNNCRNGNEKFMRPDELNNKENNVYDSNNKSYKQIDIQCLMRQQYNHI